MFEADLDSERDFAQEPWLKHEYAWVEGDLGHRYLAEAEAGDPAGSTGSGPGAERRI